MHLMMMHKNQPSAEAGQMPDQELITKMGALIGEYGKSGRLVDGAGLLGSKHRTRLSFRDGHCTVKHGPYRGEHELPAAMLLLKVKTREEAIGWAERYGKILGDGEIELGKVTEAWDLGLVPEPPDHPIQMLLIEKADRATESGDGRSTSQKSQLTRLQTEMTKAGVLQRSHRLSPSAGAKRLLVANGDARIIDGPFTESKELIGGFVLLDLSGVDEAIAICRRYAAILGGAVEMDIRGVEPSDDPPAT